MNGEEMHPDIYKAVNSIKNPRVQELVEELSRYGLGVCVPHAHDERGRFIPLEKGMASYEERLSVEFRSVKEREEGYLSVGWRWDHESNSPSVTAKCEYGKCD